MQGLPRDYQDFILSTDDHQLSTYTARARQNHARQDTSVATGNCGQQTVAMVAELSATLNDMKVQIN